MYRPMLWELKQDKQTIKINSIHASKTGINRVKGPVGEEENEISSKESIASRDLQ